MFRHIVQKVTPKTASHDTCSVLALALCLAMTPHSMWAQSDFPFDATADTVFDIIQDSDPSTFVCLAYEGRTMRQMWDKRQNDEFDLEVFLFTAHFSDMPPIDIILNPEFETPEAAREEARRVTDADTSIESQPDLGLDRPMDRDEQLAEEARRRMARLRGEAAPAIGATTAVAAGARARSAADGVPAE